MVSLFGITAVLGVPFISGWTRRVNRRVLLSALLAILTLGNLITAISPNYPVLLVARLIMGFAHGAFWAIGVSMAMGIVEERHASRAAAIVMSGLSIAAVAGLPLGTFLESLTGWRTTFLIWSGLSALVFLAVATIVPSLPSRHVRTGPGISAAQCVGAQSLDATAYRECVVRVQSAALPDDGLREQPVEPLQFQKRVRIRSQTRRAWPQVAAAVQNLMHCPVDDLVETLPLERSHPDQLVE